MDGVAFAFEQAVDDVALSRGARARCAATFAVRVEWVFTGAENKALE
jgi:hypothetical protein